MDIEEIIDKIYIIFQGVALNFTHVIEKIKDIISHEHPDKKIFDKDVADILGLSKESLSHMKKRNSMPYEAVAYFCAQRKISINWLLFDQMPQSLEEETSKFAYVRYLKDFHASAGGGAFNEKFSHEALLIDHVFLHNLYRSSSYNADNLLALHVIGDSMESTLCDRDIILCDQSEKDISKGGIFVVSTVAGVFVKRIALKTDGSIELISDNKNYNSEIIALDEMDSFEIVAKVVACLGIV